KRAMDTKEKGGHAIVGGYNYGQGSSREHAALAPRYLGLRAVLVIDYARIHWQNLVNFGILPLTFVNENDYDELDAVDVIKLINLKNTYMKKNKLTATLTNQNKEIKLAYSLSDRQKENILQGGLINWIAEKNKASK